MKLSQEDLATLAIIKTNLAIAVKENDRKRLDTGIDGISVVLKSKQKLFSDDEFENNKQVINAISKYFKNNKPLNKGLFVNAKRYNRKSKLISKSFEKEMHRYLLDNTWNLEYFFKLIAKDYFEVQL